MTSDVLISDTHPVVWYALKKHRKLSSRVRRAFDAAISGQGAIYVPSIVVFEVSLLMKKDRIKPPVSFDRWVAELFANPGIYPLHFEESDSVISHGLSFTDDPFDTMIVASALRLDCPLITNDSLIHEKHPCEIIW